VGSESLVPLIKRCPACLGNGYTTVDGLNSTCESCDGIGELFSLDQLTTAFVNVRHELRTIRREILAIHWYEVSMGDLACTVCRVPFPCATVAALSVTLT
jgi:DnaJ-class molecular chaperone